MNGYDNNELGSSGLEDESVVTAFDSQYNNNYENVRQSFDDSEYAGDGYASPDNTNTEFSDQGYNNAGYNSAAYGSEGYGNTDYNNSGYNNSGYGNEGYDNAAYNNSGYNNSAYNNQGYNGNYENTGYSNSGYDNQQGLNLDFNTKPVKKATAESKQTSPSNGSSNQDFTGVDEDFAKATESTLKALGDELTPAEIEDMKREKAARRRKRMLREKKRKERMRQAIIRCTLLGIAVILVIVIIVKIFAGIGGLIKGAKKKHATTTESVSTEATTTEEPVASIDEEIVARELPATREEALEMLKAQGETDSDINNIVENEAVYPDIMLKHLAVNSELIDFALNYPAKISIPFDGDFSIEAEPGEMSLLMQYDPEWGYADYGDTVLGLNGAAPTCLSMAYIYLTGDGTKNPIIIGDFSMEKGYLDENGNTDYKLMTEGAEELGLESNELDVDKDNLIGALDEGNAVICEVLSGDFTKEKSYIVISDYRNGFFYVNDPTSRARSQVGWDFKRLSSQISTMWSLKRGSAASVTDDTDGTADTEGADGVSQEGADNGNADGTDNGTADGTGGGSQTDNGGADTGTE